MTEQEKALKAAKILTAWANGKEIELYYLGDWLIYNGNEPPNVELPENLRIKPKTKKQKFRVALLKGSSGYFSEIFADLFTEVEESSHFVKWLTEEIEYEVSEIE